MNRFSKIGTFYSVKVLYIFLSPHEVSGIVNTTLMKLLALKESKEHLSKIKIVPIFSIGGKKKNPTV